MKIVPWTIQNKYYTADVHFKVVPVEDWVHSHLEGVPALIYAFSVDDEVCSMTNERLEQMQTSIFRFSKDRY